MNRWKTSATAVAVIVAGLGMTGVAAAADGLSEVVVEAGPVTKSVVGRTLASGAPIELVTVDYHVNYSDLDLVKHADVMTLNKRIESAAKDACQQLDELYPVERAKLRSCMQDAIRGASHRIQAAITAAQDRGQSN